MKILDRSKNRVTVTVDDEGKSTAVDSVSGKEMTLEEYRELLRRRKAEKDEGKEPEAKPDAD
jgi:hypothetical protein